MLRMDRQHAEETLTEHPVDKIQTVSVRHAVFEDSKVPVELVGLREEQFALQRQFKRRFPVSSSLLSFLVPVDGFKFAAGSVFGH